MPRQLYGAVVWVSGGGGRLLVITQFVTYCLNPQDIQSAVKIISALGAGIEKQR